QTREVALYFSLGLRSIDNARVGEFRDLAGVIDLAICARNRHTRVSIYETIWHLQNRILDLLMYIIPLRRRVLGDVRSKVIARAEVNNLSGTNVRKPCLNAV